MRAGSIIAIFLLSVAVCFGQRDNVKMAPDEECMAMLKQAESFYESGAFIDCVTGIEKILAAYDLKKFDRVHALELAAKASVEAGDMGKADTYVNVMLKLFPHYDLKEEENSESFNRLVKKYKIHPVLSLGVRNAADWMNYNTTKVITFNGIHYDTPYQKKLEGILNDFGIMYYGWGEIEFNRGISLNGDLTFKWTNFNRDMASAPPIDLSFWEHDSFMEIPIYVKKYFKVTKNTMAYAAAGMGWLYLLNATGNAYIYFQDQDSSSTLEGFDMLPYRNRNTFEWIAGTGFGYKYRNLRMFFDARYYGGLNSITNPEKGIGDGTLVNDFFYIDNTVRLTQFELGVSISYTLFNSVKKTSR
jgi:Outer membrane protein beta-barrel domain